MMKLRHDEELFLRRWMFEEYHFRNGVGPAKRLQLENRVISADLAVIIAAAIPDPSEQLAAGLEAPPEESPRWPWSEESFRTRVADAKAVVARIAKRRPSGASVEV
jgi:hypothetical protein